MVKATANGNKSESAKYKLKKQQQKSCEGHQLAVIAKARRNIVKMFKDI